MTAVRGEINDGYVALDDFSFATNEEFCSTKPEDATPTTSTTPPITPTTTIPHKQLPNCNFDEDTCGWELFGLLDFKWEITDSKTLAEGGHDAPSSDHSGMTLHQYQ